MMFKLKKIDIFLISLCVFFIISFFITKTFGYFDILNDESIKHAFHLTSMYLARYSLVLLGFTVIMAIFKIAVKLRSI